MALNKLKGLSKQVKKEDLIQDKSLLEQLDGSYLGKMKITHAEQKESKKGSTGVRFVLETLDTDPQRAYIDLWVLDAKGEVILFNYRVLGQMSEILGVNLDKLEVVEEGEGDNKKETLPQFVDKEIELHIQHKWEKATEGNNIGKYFIKHEIQSVFCDDRLTLGEKADDIVKPHRYLKADELVEKWNMTRTKPADEIAPARGNSKAKVQAGAPEEDF